MNKKLIYVTLSIKMKRIEGANLFGYIKSFQPELKMVENDLYRSIYCGLCKQLGRSFGPLARFTLSYDFAFMSLLQLSMNEDCLRLERQRCAANPFINKSCCCTNQALLNSADTAMIMLYYKIKDNIADSHGIKKLKYLLALPYAKRAYKKAVANQPDIDQLINDNMMRQAQLEEANCNHIDEVSDPSASSLAAICETFSEDPSQKRVLSRFGYCLGRWVYLMDAADDYLQDLKNKAYNILALQNNFSTDAFTVRQSIEPSLNLTLGEVASSYHLLNINRFKSILDNIIFQGLPYVQKNVLAGQPIPKIPNVTLVTSTKEEHYEGSI